MINQFDEQSMGSFDPPTIGQFKENLLNTTNAGLRNQSRDSR